MWSEFEREVNKQPHNTLTSLKAKISEVMINNDREIEAVVEASGDLSKQMCI
jgi:hypothetical protein